jgi:hypothetical protein
MTRRACGSGCAVGTGDGDPEARGQVELYFDI